MIIREELPGDVLGIRKVEEAGFGQKAEADLVDLLRQRKSVTLSLVAEDNGEIVGHVLFSPGEVSNGVESWPCVGMGPVVVMPGNQGTGIGKKLIEAGVEKCFLSGVKAIFVLGDPEYYTRFGFICAKWFDIRCEFDAPVEAFMVKAAGPEAMDGWNGVMHYRPEFKEV